VDSFPGHGRPIEIKYGDRRTLVGSFRVKITCPASDVHVVLEVDLGRLGLQYTGQRLRGFR